MSQSSTSKLEAAEVRTQETRAFVRQVRAAARRKYTPEEKIRIVLEGFRREVTVSDLCRREGIKPGAFYAWTKDFMEAGKERLTRDMLRDATRQEIERVKRESNDLKQLVAELSLEVHRLKKTAIPTLEDVAGIGALAPGRSWLSWSEWLGPKAPNAGCWLSWAYPGARITGGGPGNGARAWRDSQQAVESPGTVFCRGRSVLSCWQRGKPPS